MAAARSQFYFITLVFSSILHFYLVYVDDFWTYSARSSYQNVLMYEYIKKKVLFFFKMEKKTIMNSAHF